MHRSCKSCVKPPPRAAGDSTTPSPSVSGPSPTATEVLIFVTELTANYYSARFIGRYGCDRYYLHNKQLQFGERRPGDRTQAGRA